MKSADREEEMRREIASLEEWGGFIAEEARRRFVLGDKDGASLSRLDAAHFAKRAADVRRALSDMKLTKDRDAGDDG